MHPLFESRLRPIAAVVLVFFTWFSIEPWNYALAAQDLPTTRVIPATESRPKAPSAPELFENNLRFIKEQVRSAREGDAYQAQLAGLLKSLEQAVAQSSRELEEGRRAVDRLARAIEQGAPSHEAIKAFRTQEQSVKAAVGLVRLNASGIEGLLKGMALPAGLTKDQKQAKEAVTGLVKAFDETLTAMMQRAEQQRGFESQEHQAFLTASMDLDQGLATLHTRVQAVAKEATPERRRAQLWEEVFSKRDTLLSADREIRKEFDQTEAFLKEKGLPQEILDRHEAAVSDYEKNFNQLKGYLTQVDQAHRAYVSATERGNETAAQAAERDLESTLSAFDDFLKANVKDPPHQPLDPNNLPHRTPKPTERKPRLKKEEFAEFQPQIRLAYNGDPGNLMLAQATSDLPTPADLAETIEVQFTPEIQTLAAELEHNPVKIYNWVHNNIDFVPTYGSIQGAHMCLLTKQCNDMDTASLLIALLRTSGIAARYVIGTIEVPIAQVMNWVGGFSSAGSAVEFIASGGIPVSPVASGGGISAVRLEHAWVETYVDYIPYRGAVNGTGDTWIPLDASLKQYQHLNGIDVDTSLPIDIDAEFFQVESQSVIDTAVPAITGIPVPTVEAQISDFQARLNDYLATNVPEITTFQQLSETLHGARKIVRKDLKVLPNTLGSAKVVAQSTPLSELPANLRYTVELLLEDALSNSVGYSVPLAQIAGKRVTLSYVAASQVDAELMSNASGFLGFPLYLVQVVPELKIEGQTVASGQPVGMGLGQVLRVAFNQPGGAGDQVRHSVQTGGYYAVGLNPSKVTFPYLSNRVAPWNPEMAPTRDGRLGELLHVTSMHYFAGLDFWGDELAQTSGIARLTHPSEGLVGLNGNATYLLGVPFKIGSVGLNIDVARILTSAVSKAGDREAATAFATSQGLNSSILEHLIFESNFGLKSFSAVRAMELANVQQIPIYVLDRQNVQRVEELELSNDERQSIRNLISAGRTVLVPKRQVQYVDYVGTGYIALDRTTGSGAYIISGGLNGGGTVETVGARIEKVLELARELIGDDALNKTTYRIYVADINLALSLSPGIEDRPVTDFPEFDNATKRQLRYGKLGKRLPFGQEALGGWILWLLLNSVEDITLGIP